MKLVESLLETSLQGLFVCLFVCFKQALFSPFFIITFINPKGEKQLSFILSLQ